MRKCSILDDWANEVRDCYRRVDFFRRGKVEDGGDTAFLFFGFVHLCGLFIIVSEDRSCTGKVFIHFGLSESEFVLYISIFLVYLMGHNVQ